MAQLLHEEPGAKVLIVRRDPRDVVLSCFRRVVRPNADTFRMATLEGAAQAYDQAERQYQRMVTLRQTNVVSAQQLEDVEIRRNSALSEREAARARVVTARQQLERTEVRAPFDGIVSDRKVSAGDTAQMGKELLKVIDPSSLRFEGLVATVGTPEALGEFVKQEEVRWGKIVKDAGITDNP